MPIKPSLSDEIVIDLLKKWGIKMGTGMELSIQLPPGAFATVTITKLLAESEMKDLAEALGVYYLVKQGYSQSEITASLPE